MRETSFSCILRCTAVASCSHKIVVFRVAVPEFDPSECSHACLGAAYTSFFQVQPVKRRTVLRCSQLRQVI